MHRFESPCGLDLPERSGQQELQNSQPDCELAFAPGLVSPPAQFRANRNTSLAPVAASSTTSAIRQFELDGASGTSVTGTLSKDPPPDRSAIELDGHSIGRNYRGFVPIERPYSARILDITPRGLATFVYEIEVSTVALRDEPKLRLTGWTVDADVASSEIDVLRRRRADP